MSPVDIATAVLILSGALFCMIGGVGVLRVPDFYTRTHAASIPDTLGAGLILVGLMLQGGGWIVTVKLVFVLILLLLTGPTANHALVKAAHASGVQWQGEDDTHDTPLKTAALGGDHADPG
jgi:multicomponent Na+:H+ antiporter subunit G